MTTLPAKTRPSLTDGTLTYRGLRLKKGTDNGPTEYAPTHWEGTIGLGATTFRTTHPVTQCLCQPRCHWVLFYDSFIEPSIVFLDYFSGPR